MFILLLNSQYIINMSITTEVSTDFIQTNENGHLGIGLTNPISELDVSGIITLRGHILPKDNAQYDLGSAEKIRHLFLSDNSLWIGDDHKIDIKDGKIKFKKRNNNIVPKKILDKGGDDTEALKYIFGDGHTQTLENLTPEHWLKYSMHKGFTEGGEQLGIDHVYSNPEHDFLEDFSVDDNVKNANGYVGIGVTSPMSNSEVSGSVSLILKVETTVAFRYVAINPLEEGIIHLHLLSAKVPIMGRD